MPLIPEWVVILFGASVLVVVVCLAVLTVAFTIYGLFEMINGRL